MGVPETVDVPHALALLQSAGNVTEPTTRAGNRSTPFPMRNTRHPAYLTGAGAANLGFVSGGLTAGKGGNGASPCLTRKMVQPVPIGLKQ